MKFKISFNKEKISEEDIKWYEEHLKNDKWNLEKIGDNLYIIKSNPLFKNLKNEGIINIIEIVSEVQKRKITGSEIVFKDGKEMQIYFDDFGDYFFETDQWKCLRCGEIIGYSWKKEKTRIVHPEIPDEDLVPLCPACERKAMAPLWNERLRKMSEIWNYIEVSECTNDLYEKIKNYIKKHLFLVNEIEYDILTCISIQSWLKELVPNLPNLIFLGETGAGKSRAIKTLRQVMYRPILVSTASPASVRRVIDSYNASIMISEFTKLISKNNESLVKEYEALICAGFYPDESKQAIADVNNNKDIVIYDVRTNWIIGTQQTLSEDVMNRGFLIKMQEPERKYPLFIEDQAKLRGELLDLRYNKINEYDIDIQETANRIEEMGLKNRDVEKLSSLLTVYQLFHNDEECDKFIDDLIAFSTNIDIQNSYESFYMKMIDILEYCILRNKISLKDITEIYNEQIQGERLKSSNWIGKILSGMQVEKSRIQVNGKRQIFINVESAKKRIAYFKRKYGLQQETLLQQSNNNEKSLNEDMIIDAIGSCGDKGALLADIDDYIIENYNGDIIYSGKELEDFTYKLVKEGKVIRKEIEGRGYVYYINGDTYIDGDTKETAIDTISSLLNIITEVESEYNSIAPLEVVIERAEEYGIIPERTEELISKLEEKKEIYRPKEGYIKRIVG